VQITPVRPAGLEIIDTRLWQARMIAPLADEFFTGDGLVIPLDDQDYGPVTHLGLTGYSLDGKRSCTCSATGLPDSRTARSAGLPTSASGREPRSSTFGAGDCCGSSGCRTRTTRSSRASAGRRLPVVFASGAPAEMARPHSCSQRLHP